MYSEKPERSSIAALPKAHIASLFNHLYTLRLSSPIQIGEVIVSDYHKTGVGVVVFEDEISRFIVSRLYAADGGDGVTEGESEGEAKAVSGEVEPAVDTMEQFIQSIVLEDIDLKYGRGQENTRSIVGFFGPGLYPAWLCSDLVLNGKDDWFLPSAEELGKLMEFLRQCETGSDDLPVRFAHSGEYWSSTLEDVFVAWVGTAGSWSVDTRAIVNEGFVRPVRAF